MELFMSRKNNSMKLIQSNFILHRMHRNIPMEQVK